MILIEPGMITREIFDEAFRGSTTFKRVIQMTRECRDTWPSRSAALEWFSKRNPWSRWDNRALNLFIEYGLRDLPSAKYPDKKKGVTLCCTREQEAQSYIYFEDAFDSLDRLKELCLTIPVHTILGRTKNLVSKKTHDSIIDPKQGRPMASVVEIDSGHLIAQEQPTELALALWNIINTDDSKLHRSKL